jgi:HAD superfamily hydrolase (TIGR01509 family)
MFKAVLFDLDGLLADSEPLQKAAWRTYLAQHGRTLDQLLIDRMFGLRLIDSASLIKSQLALPHDVEQIMHERDEVFLGSLPGRLQPMPYACEAVIAVKERGLRTALATSGHRRYVNLALHELGIVSAFDVIVTGDSVKHGKPAPDIFLRAAELLALPAACCIVVEDAPNGIAAARAAGMMAVAVPNAMTRNLDFGAADLLFPSLQAFCQWIEQQEHCS